VTRSASIFQDVSINSRTDNSDLLIMRDNLLVKIALHALNVVHYMASVLFFGLFMFYFIDLCCFGLIISCISNKYTIVLMKLSFINTAKLPHRCSRRLELASYIFVQPPYVSCGQFRDVLRTQLFSRSTHDSRGT